MPTSGPGVAGAPAVVAIVGDLHINSTVGLCPSRVQLDDGGTYHPSKAQWWILRCWDDYWQHVAAIERSALYVVVNGDLVEGLHHRATQLVTHNEETQLDMALQLLEPVARLADYLFVVRGTEAHTGPSAQWEEHLADDLSAVRDKVGLTASWWYLPLEVEGVTFDIQHHPQRRSMLLSTRDVAASREADGVWQAYHEIDRRPPDVVVRSHAHYWAKGWSREVFCCICPPWQVSTAYGNRLGVNRRVEPVGGLIFLCSDGRCTWPEGQRWPVKRYKPIPRKVWTSARAS